MIITNINMTPPLDIGFGYFLSTTFIFGSFVVFLAVVFIETLILWGMKWASFRRSLITSVLMNVVTGIIGILIFLAMTLLGLFINFIPYWISSWLLSTLLEGIFLFYSGQKSRRAWIVAGAANMGSYLLIVPIAWYLNF